MLTEFDASTNGRKATSYREKAMSNEL